MGLPSFSAKTKTGYFRKEGHVFRNWKMRFFVLEGGILSYYEKADDEHVPIGESKGALDMTQYKLNEKKTKGDKIMLSPLTPGGDLGEPYSCSCSCLSCP